MKLRSRRVSAVRGLKAESDIQKEEEEREDSPDTMQLALYEEDVGYRRNTRSLRLRNEPRRKNGRSPMGISSRSLRHGPQPSYAEAEYSD